MLTYQEIAEAYNVSHVTILNWVTQKDSLIAECIECARIYPEALNLSIASEGESPTKLSNEKQLELLKENRRIKIEDSRKKDHIAYLESLLELNNIDPTKISKKKEKAIRYAKEIKHRTNIKSLCVRLQISPVQLIINHNRRVLIMS
jgi:hypothetical protein